MANTKDAKRTCFIITPIGGTSTPIRRKIDGIIDEVIERVLKELGYEMLVSHRINDSGSVTNAIIKGVYESNLVIANLTGNNPNVMYEVALRHASGRPIIHITENIGELPFDINDQRTISFTDDMAGAHQLKDDLRVMIRNIDFEVIASNPVTDALGKKNLVNIPRETSTEFGEMLFMIHDEMNQIKKEITTIKDGNIKSEPTFMIEYISPNKKKKSEEEERIRRILEYYKNLKSDDEKK